MIRGFWFFTLLTTAMNSIAQSNIIDPKLLYQNEVPKPPDVANMEKYTMTPPNFSNGLPQQNISLFEIRENGLSFPVSLFYNYSGFRIKEDATSVGLGWGLSEAMIIREVKDIPDEIGVMKRFQDYGESYEEEFDHGLVDNQYTYSWDPDVYDELDHGYHNLTYNRQYYKYYDCQPDVYRFNFLGYSGKFLWLNDEVTKLDHNDLLITGQRSLTDGLLYFTITTPDGVACTFAEFDKLEITPSTPVQPKFCDNHPEASYYDQIHTTTWRMTEMRSNITQAWIKFTYQMIGSSQVKTVDQVSSFTIYSPLRENGDFWGTSYSQDNSYTNTATQSYYINSIESEHFKAVYQTTSRLDNSNGTKVSQISIFNKDNLTTPIKTISFTHGYFGISSDEESCWLKLQSVHISGAGVENQYNFAYCNESGAPGRKSDLSIDHWGYFNGASSNVSLIPYNQALQNQIQYESSMNISPPYGNRDVAFVYACYFALQKVTYPTKGYTQFTYESSDGKGIRVKSLEDNDGILSNFKYYDYGPGSDQPDPAYYDYRQYIIHQNCTNYVTNPDDFPISYPINQMVTVYGSQPVQSVAFFPETSPFYEQVTEFIGTPDGRGGKTVYHFTQFSGLGDENVLSEKDQYEYGNDIPVMQEKYSYSIPILKQIKYWYIPELQDELVVSSPCYADGTGENMCGPADPAKGYILQNVTGGSSYIQTYWKRLDEVETTVQGVHTSKKYFYKDVDPVTGLAPSNTSAIRVEETRSDGKSQTTYFFYPGDRDPDNSALTLGIPEMWEPSNLNFSHDIGSAIKTQSFVNSTLIAQEQSHYTYDAVNNLVLKSDYESLPTGQSTGMVKWTFAYDDKAKLIDASRVGGIPKCFLFDYNRLFVVAEVENATHDQVAYTSFEPDGQDSWTGIVPSNIQSTGGITGSKSYLLSGTTVRKTGLNSSLSYIVSYWSNSGASKTVTGSTDIRQGLTYNGWTYFEHTVSNTTTVDISGSGNIDELRLYPKGAQMKTYTYDILRGVTSICDLRSKTTYFEYDGSGRLLRIRDMSGNILKQYDYQYGISPN